MKTKKIALTTIGICIKAYMLVSFLAIIAHKSKKKRSKFLHARFREHAASISEG